jgi:RNA polymerase sigma-70 factor (ECF subfamily)
VQQAPQVAELVEEKPVKARIEARSDAFLRLAHEHLDAAYGLARAILRDPGEAEDATHDAVVQAWRRWSTLRDASRFQQWFDRILVNTCRNRLQRATRERARDISAEVANASGDPFTDAHDRDAIGTAVGTLSPDHRVVIALRYYRDLTIDDIATRLDIPAGTVQSRLHYALKELQRALDATDFRGGAR